jgi:hypothetical protein
MVISYLHFGGGLLLPSSGLTFIEKVVTYGETVGKVIGIAGQ